MTKYRDEIPTVHSFIKHQYYLASRRVLSAQRRLKRAKEERSMIHDAMEQLGYFAEIMKKIDHREHGHFLRRIDDLVSTPMENLRVIRDYCLRMSNESDNASIIGYHSALYDIMNQIMSIRNMMTGEEIEEADKK